jgi:hypothetical protein
LQKLDSGKGPKAVLTGIPDLCCQMLQLQESFLERGSFENRTAVFDNLSPFLLMKFSLKTTGLNTTNISPKTTKVFLKLYVYIN